MVGLELVRTLSGREPAPEAAARLKAICREQGVLIGVGGYFGNVVRIQPPLVVTEDQLGFVTEVLDGALRELQRS